MQPANSGFVAGKSALSHFYFITAKDLPFVWLDARDDGVRQAASGFPNPAVAHWEPADLQALNGIYNMLFRWRLLPIILPCFLKAKTDFSTDKQRNFLPTLN